MGVLCLGFSQLFLLNLAEPYVRFHLGPMAQNPINLDSETSLPSAL